MNVLIYSSKEMYDQAPFEGRAEADLIAYATYDLPHSEQNKKEQDLDLIE
jgi:hypothetical protein